MKISIGSDHAGFEVKESLKQVLEAAQHELLDMGTNGTDSCDYPDFAGRVGQSVARGESERGILICGTGIGMCITANKVPGIRAALVTDAFTSEMSRRHNNANVFCAGARVLSLDMIEDCLHLWLKTPYEGGRHERRVGKIEGVREG